VFNLTSGYVPMNWLTPASSSVALPYEWAKSCEVVNISIFIVVVVAVDTAVGLVVLLPL
jgi:hypothetical protein